jgi:hypothetical protein
MFLFPDPTTLIILFAFFALLGVASLVVAVVRRLGRSRVEVLEAENRRLREQLAEDRRLQEQLEENRRLREQLEEKRARAEPSAAPDRRP